MTIPIPSAVRTVRIYSGAQMLATRGISPAVPYRWSLKHPLDADWWWVDATGYCSDASTTILQIGASIVSGDTSLSIAATYQTADGLYAGIQLAGGTAATSYTVRVKITFASGAMESWDISIPMQNVPAPPTPNLSLVTNNHDIVLLGGIPFPTGT
jgi:hypothetical protein